MCGNCIKFVNLTDQEESILSSDGDGIGCFAVNPTNLTVGFSDLSMEPKIFVYTYPNLTTYRAKLKGGAKLEYSCIAFAHNRNIVASYSGVPDFKLTIWNWMEGEMLCSLETEEMFCLEMSFSPTSWKHLFTVGDHDSVCLWNIEQSNQRHLLTPNVIKLPFFDGSDEIDEYEDVSKTLSRMSNPLSSTSIKMTKAAIAGIDISKLKTFLPGDEKERCSAISHCWSNDGVIYLGCKRGFLLSLDCESKNISVLMECNLNESSEQGFDVIQEG